MAETVNDIIAAIHAAFHGAPLGEITLHEAKVIDTYGAMKERARGRRLDVAPCWEAIPDSHLEECSGALSHLDPQSWRYYLPRFMEWALTHYRTSKSITVDYTIYALLLTDDDALINQHLRERYRQLTAEQTRVVCRFLQFMALEDGHVDAASATQALRRFWGRFSADRADSAG